MLSLAIKNTAFDMLFFENLLIRLVEASTCQGS
jgi:hypothetical protein